MPGYRVRAQFFGLARAVYHPAGRAPIKRGGAFHPPKPFQPPPDKVWELADFDAARELARQIRLEYGDMVAVDVAPIDPPPAAPRPRQQPLFNNLPTIRR